AGPCKQRALLSPGRQLNPCLPRQPLPLPSLTGGKKGGDSVGKAYPQITSSSSSGFHRGGKGGVSNFFGGAGGRNGTMSIPSPPTPSFLLQAIWLF
uniref:Uncharacterized protein n=1 Tax=Naja naja TaxID=35670 RepID=A0A8C6XPQ5_NAJNA